MRAYKHYCTAGELQTWIDIVSPANSVDADGFPAQTLTSIWKGFRPCRWINTHGKEAWESSARGLAETATVTLRYDANITPTCQVSKGGEYWEIVSMDDIRARGRWLELQVKRIVPAR